MNLNQLLNNKSYELIQIKKKYEIVLIAHVLEPVGNINIEQIQCEYTEFFNPTEFNEIYNGLVHAGFYIKNIFFNEIDLIKDMLKDANLYKNVIIYNLARNGVGMSKKVSIPAICDLLKIPYTSSSSLACSLSRNKFYFSKLLEGCGISTPKTWGYLGKGQWVDDKSPPNNFRIIIKPVSDSASQGITENSIIQYNSADNEILELHLNKSDVKLIVIQEYIKGFECEVPLFEIDNKVIALDPIKIHIESNEILTYELSLTDKYSFDTLSNYFDSYIINAIKENAIQAFKLLDLKKYGRVDFRITPEGKFYIFDISTTPYTTLHSSFAYAFTNMNLKYQDIYNMIICCSLST